MGGSEYYTAKLAQALTERGHEVTVYTSADSLRSPQPYRVRNLPRVSPPGSGYILWPGALRGDVVREIASADVLHAVNFSMFSTLMLLAIGRRHHRPLVMTAFYHPPYANPRRPLNALYDRTVGRLMLAGYDAVILHSAREQEELLRYVAMRPRARVFRMMSPSILAGVRPGPSFRARFGLEGRFLALYVGRLDSHKGATTLLRAAAKLKRQGGGANFALAIVGKAEEWFRLPPEFEQLRGELADVVHLPGPLVAPDLASAYAESDVAVVPSRYESYGLTTVEALSYGTPVISTRTGIAPEIVRPGETGYLFDYGDAAALAACLRQARRTAAGMREAAAKSVAGLSWERTVDAVQAIYRQVGAPA